MYTIIVLKLTCLTAVMTT